MSLRLGLFCSVVLCSCAAPVTPESPHLLFSADAQSLDNPFPDARLVQNGTLKLRPRWYAPFLAQKAQTAKAKVLFDTTAEAMEHDVASFGNFSGVLLRASAALDPASVKGHLARVLYGDTVTVLERDVATRLSAEFLAEANLPAQPDFPEFLFVRPSVPLPEGRDGALVVLKGLMTADGHALERGRDFEAATTTAQRKQVADALGVAETEVLLVLPQHGVPTTSLMKALATWAEAHPATATIPAKGMVPDGNSQRPVGNWTSSDPDWSTFTQWFERQTFGQPATHPGRVVIGQFSAHDLRDAHAHFDPAFVSDPSTAPVVPLWFVLVLPKGPTPPGGWPVVMGQHGFGGRNTPLVGTDDTFCMEWAEVLTARGLGCIGIDAPSHGTRGNSTGFFAVEDLQKLRDHFREMTFDLLQEERLVATLDVDGDGTPDLNPNPRYFGNSLGSIMGAGFAPFANHVTSMSLNVPGGGLGNIISSPVIHDLLGLLFVAQTDIGYGTPEYEAAFPALRVVAQSIVDPADPINLIGQTPPSRAVLLQEGLRDLNIPNEATEDLAHALGAQVATAPLTGTAPLHVLTHVDPAKYLAPADVAAFDGHDIMYSFEAARAQVLQFLSSDGRELPAP